MENDIGKQHWIINNERIKNLSEQTRRELFNLITDDVRLAIENNGYSDEITNAMINESEEIGTYWGMW